MTKNSKYIITVIILLFLAAGFVFWRNQQNVPASFQMRGNVVEINDNIITFNGGFDVDEKKGAEPKHFEVKVNNNTKISRTLLFVPTGIGMFMVGDLVKEEAAVDFETLKLDSSDSTAGLEITLKKNIFGKPKMTAAEIKYRIMEYRDLPSFPPLP